MLLASLYLLLRRPVGTLVVLGGLLLILGYAFSRGSHRNAVR